MSETKASPQRSRFQPVDASVVPRFADVATFMRTQRHDVSDELDIALVGVPFDLGVNYRSGARQGPAGVREASRVIRKIHPTSGIAPYDICNVADVGDVPINPMNKDRSIADIEAFYGDLASRGITPISIGGDHTVPTPIIRGLADASEPIGIVHVDAHADVLDIFCEDEVNHATFMRRVTEEGLVDPSRVVQIGLRGSRFADDDIQYGLDMGYTVITIDDYEEMGRAAVIEAIANTIGDGPTYVTIDIDGFDPAFLPGTGVPEIGGITPRDMQVILRSLRGRHLVGGDLCEIVPSLDPTGMTCITVANLMFEMLCVTADSVASRRGAQLP